MSFKINQKFIASNICEKKDIPKNDCEGGCFLRKELQKESQKAEKDKNNTKNIADFYIPNDVFSQNIFTDFIVKNTFFAEKNLHSPPKNPNKLLRPPQVI